ncbi:MAG: hypothetical protein HUU37_01250 [Bdellovibrionales bacterium]|nr:hypothetical protein [Bdellovibrionales bacterium]
MRKSVLRQFLCLFAGLFLFAQSARAEGEQPAAQSSATSLLRSDVEYYTLMTGVTLTGFYAFSRMKSGHAILGVLYGLSALGSISWSDRTVPRAYVESGGIVALSAANFYAWRKSSKNNLFLNNVAGLGAVLGASYLSDRLFGGKKSDIKVDAALFEQGPGLQFGYAF